MGAPKLLSLARVAKRCNSNPGVLTKQIRSGVWGQVQLIERSTKRSEKRLFMPYGQAAVLIEFHNHHAPLETVAKNLGENKKRVKRALEGFNKLRDNHPALAFTGGKIGVKKVGSFHYIELKHVPRLKRAMNEFISLEQASRETGLGHGTLPNLLRRGFWPETGLVNFGNRQSMVHQSVVQKARKFVRDHYPLSEAAKRAGTSQSGFHKWIHKWNYPAVRLPSKINESSTFIPKKGFKELVRAFKQGKHAAAPVAEKYQPRKQYGARELLDKFDLKETNTAVDAAHLLNQCNTRMQQLEVEENLQKLSETKELTLSTAIKSTYLRLLREGGGVASPLGRGISELVKTHLQPGLQTTWTGELTEEVEHERQFGRRNKFTVEEEASLASKDAENIIQLEKTHGALTSLLQTRPLNRFSILKEIMAPYMQKQPTAKAKKKQAAKTNSKKR